jgi:RNA polymerase sigma factor (sigma-70 family)
VALVGSSSPMNREELFLSQLPDIQRVIKFVCARRYLRGAEAEDFGSAVMCRLVENNYEVLAKFQGRCSLRTYLTVVIGRLYIDFQVQRFGKWRSSAAARRLGSAAVNLERLMYRDGRSFDEACGVLTTDPRVSETRDALYEISVRLPYRSPRQRANLAAEPPPAQPGPPGLQQGERQELATRASAVIRGALARLPPRERMFLRVHLVEGLSVAQVSRSLRVDQKALYRRKEEIFKAIRADLEREGIGAGEARELLSALDWEADFFDEVGPGDTLQTEAETRPSPPATEASRRVGDK